MEVLVDPPLGTPSRAMLRSNLFSMGMHLRENPATDYHSQRRSTTDCELESGLVYSWDPITDVFRRRAAHKEKERKVACKLLKTLKRTANGLSLFLSP